MEGPPPAQRPAVPSCIPSLSLNNRLALVLGSRTCLGGCVCLPCAYLVCLYVPVFLHTRVHGFYGLPIHMCV